MCDHKSNIINTNSTEHYTDEAIKLGAHKTKDSRNAICYEEHGQPDQEVVQCSKDEHCINIILKFDPDGEFSTTSK